MQGFINIDKPAGLTSFDVIRRLKKNLQGKLKIGHLGTLDPMVTGVLPVALGNATRVIEYITEKDKVYVAFFVLGAISDTQDAWGNITVLHEEIRFSETELQKILEQFLGASEQVPPMYSAVHHQGQRLYELARKGMEVERSPRPIFIEAIKLLDVDRKEKFPRVTIEVTCSSGTYIRTLVHDIGQRLGSGAYLSRLVRTRSGCFHLADAYPLDEVLEAEKKGQYILPIDYPLEDMAFYELDQPQWQDILHGRSIKSKEYPAQQKVRLYFAQQLIAIAGYDLKTETLRPEKVFK